MRHRDCEVLDEHNVHIEGNVVDCYVASDSGKVFEVLCNNHSSEHISVWTAVDGQQFPRAMAMKAGNMDRKMTCEDGKNGTRSLMFSNIPITDDDDAAREMSCGSELGTIQVKIVRSIFKKKTSWTAPTVAKAQNLEPIHETAKKGGLHCVSFGATMPVKKPRNKLLRVSRIDDWQAPYITFNFRYRPRAILQAHGIIESLPLDQPRVDPYDNALAGGAPSPARLTPSPPDVPQKRPRQDAGPSFVIAGSPAEDALLGGDQEDEKLPLFKDEEDESADDADAIEAQIQALRQRLDRTKSRKTRRSQSRFVKRETSPIRVGGFNGGVIDLTDD
ncbi:uncharacterized protein B0H18DRAFT_981869 [Fomitopsis serialis]|uniref:uncharacterized protein n=1 Tax=Fomitopsis serialis TaxID=139415 RepID=UPI0020075876|nr:uncharacterized protein B0H18DRAFT_981869 [Neoantrodia serialis]KAH9933752.1 hypothetical protein B0H18DRAFT_981869 [Neoantrodia serialis]